jgi:predicted esterase YcpF (UPF0227 family)
MSMLPAPLTIVYLHGLNSSPQSVKARRLGEAIAGLPLAVRPRYHVPALSHRPAQAMREVCAWIDAESAAREAQATPLALVGSSLGGYYATYLAERYAMRAILINPAVQPYANLESYLGEQRNLYTGETWELTREHFAELRALKVERIADPGRYLLMVQTGDEVLDWHEAVAFYAGGWQLVHGGGDHAFQDFDAQIAPLLRFAGVSLP